MTLLGAAAVLAAALLLASLGAFWLAVRPPRLAIPRTPGDVRLAVEDVRITTSDGLRLAAWLAVRPGRPGVVLLHGYPAEKADLLPLAAVLAPDFTVLLVDQRYFGASEGRATTLGLRERDDLSRAVDLLHARAAVPVGVFGLSLGGAVALGAAADDPRIRAVAAYAPFADLRALGHELYWWMGPVRHAFVGAMLLWGRLTLGADLSRPAPVAAAARLTIPVWLVHSRQDDQIPFRHAERLRDALAGNPRAEFLFTDRGWHGELPPAFPARLVDFFRRSLDKEVNP